MGLSTPATFDPSGKAAGITLSSGNLRAECTDNATWQNVRCTLPMASGKWYWEIDIDSPSSEMRAGIMRASDGLTSTLGSTGWSVGWYGSNGYVYQFGSQRAGCATWGTNGAHVLMIAFDADNGFIWVGKDGTYCFGANPATDTTGFNAAISDVPASTYYAAIGMRVIGAAMILRSDPATFSYAMPSGFSALVEAPVIPSVSLAMTAQPASTKSVLPSASFNIAARAPDFKSYDIEDSKLSYRCVLTGSADSLPDLVLPISSLQSRRPGDGLTYLSVVVPNAGQYVDAISARANGQIVIYIVHTWPDDYRRLFEMSRVDFDRMTDDEGGGSHSATLTGWSAAPAAEGREIAISGISYRSVTAGKRRLRASVNRYIAPGDIAVTDSESFTVGSITYAISPSLQQMEIVEA